VFRVAEFQDCLVSTIPVAPVNRHKTVLEYSPVTCLIVAVFGTYVLLLKLDNWLATLTREFACILFCTGVYDLLEIGFNFVFR